MATTPRVARPVRAQRFQKTRLFWSNVKRGATKARNWVTTNAKKAWGWITGTGIDKVKAGGRFVKTKIVAAYHWTARVLPAGARRVLGWPLRIISRIGLLGWGLVVGAVVVVFLLAGGAAYVGAKGGEIYETHVHQKFVDMSRAPVKGTVVQSDDEVIVYDAEQIAEDLKKPANEMNDPDLRTEVTIKFNGKTNTVKPIIQLADDDTKFLFFEKVKVRDEQQLVDMLLKDDPKLEPAIVGLPEQEQLEAVDRIQRFLRDLGSDDVKKRELASVWFGRFVALHNHVVLNNLFEGEKHKRLQAEQEHWKKKRSTEKDPDYSFFNIPKFAEGWTAEYDRLQAAHAGDA